MPVPTPIHARGFSRRLKGRGSDLEEELTAPSSSKSCIGSDVPTITIDRLGAAAAKGEGSQGSDKLPPEVKRRTHLW